jgi:hypothetical protein
VRKTVIDGNQFDVNDDQAWVDRYYLPCIRSIGDVYTAAALIAPRTLEVFHAAPSLAEAVTERYGAVQADTLTVRPDGLPTDALVDFLR